MAFPAQIQPAPGTYAGNWLHKSHSHSSMPLASLCNRSSTAALGGHGPQPWPMRGTCKSNRGVPSQIKRQSLAKRKHGALSIPFPLSFLCVNLGQEPEGQWAQRQKLKPWRWSYEIQKEPESHVTRAQPRLLACDLWSSRQKNHRLCLTCQWALLPLGGKRIPN